MRFISMLTGGAAILSAPKAELNTARLMALARQMPLLALVISVNTLALATIFIHSAPLALTLSAPSVLLLVCSGVAIDWLRLSGRKLDAPSAERILRRVNTAGAFLAMVYIAWALALYAHADGAQRNALTYAVALTGMFTIFALAQLPKTALLIGGMSLPGFAWLLMTAGDPTSMVAGVNVFIIMLSLFLMVSGGARDFDAMVTAQAEATLLAEDNRRLANTDSLTGLANRREFFAQIAREMAKGAEHGALVMGIVDLDGFKPVNDLYGHALGDRVLCECAERLQAFAEQRQARAENGQAFAEQGMVIARLGGDEFGVYARGRMSETEILAFGAQLCAVLKAPVPVGDAHATISASIGFARFPDDALEAQQLYERADFALYYGKQNHRGEAVLFTPDHETKMRVNARIEQCLRRANLDEEIQVEFQPLFNVVDKSIVSFEALARWNSPELGSVPPSLFIPIAERSDIIHPLTRAVMRKALKTAKSWPKYVSLSFNLSVRDLLSPRALTQIIALIETSGLETSRIDIEVTETSLLTDFDRAEEALILLKRLGVKISLDDFGTGYSSLSYVHRLPLDKIKIDRSFIQEIHGNGVARDIVKSMIGMIGNLNLDCVTEGVETSEQYDMLRAFGCDVVQGFLFSRPIPQDDVSRFIAETHANPIMIARA